MFGSCANFAISFSCSNACLILFIPHRLINRYSKLYHPKQLQTARSCLPLPMPCAPKQLNKAHNSRNCNRFGYRIRIELQVGYINLDAGQVTMITVGHCFKTFVQFCLRHITSFPHTITLQTVFLRTLLRVCFYMFFEVSHVYSLADGTRLPADHSPLEELSFK